MQNTRYSLFSILFLFFSILPTHATQLDKAAFLKLKHAVYEVVRPLGLDAPNVTYKEALNYDLLPHHLKKDRTVSFGTAFAIDQKHLVTAAHVLNLQQQTSFIKDVRIKDENGKLYEIDQVSKFSQLEDYVVFTLKTYPKDMTYLTLANTPAVGDTVSAVGNALGQGVVQREGRVSSFTNEESEGKWKYIRFTAPASPGNSGGPLINDKGDVVGIVVKKSEDENLNYAVPIQLLQDDKGKNAQFYSRDLAEQESGEQLFTTWKASFALPQTMLKLSNMATDAYIDGIKQRRAEFEEKYKTAIFPGHENIEAYLHNQTMAFQMTTIEKDTGGNWDGMIYKELKDVPLSEDQHVYFGFSSVDLASMRMEAYVEKPKDMPLKKFVEDPKIYFDTILKALGFHVNMAEQRLVITSLGKALQTKRWQDVYGRTWTTSHWGFSPFDIVITSHCLAIPQGVACNVRSNPSWASRFEQFYQEKNARRTSLGYYGNIKQWKEFLSLPKDLIPKTLSTLSIDSKQQRISQTQQPQLNMSLPVKINEDDDLEVYTRLGLDLKSENISKLTFEPSDKKTLMAFTLGRAYEASPKNSKAVKKNLKDYFNQSYPYNGKQYEADSKYYQHRTVKEKKQHFKNIDSILFYTCESDKNFGKKASKKLCEQYFKNNTKP